MLRTSRDEPKRAVRVSRDRLILFCLFVVMCGAGFGLMLSESKRLYAKEPLLRIWFFDIGQGDATFIEMPTGEQILIDGGPDSAVLAKLGQIMLPWDRTIDAVVATHPDADHIGGLPSVLARYKVASIYDNGDTKSTQIAAGYFRARETEPNAARHTVRVGDVLTFGDVTLTALWPDDASLAEPDTNAASVVLLLTYNDTTVLLTGDAVAEHEPSVALLSGDIDVLKVGHHGSGGSTSATFLEMIHPETAVISAGRNNRYGHPHPAVIQRLTDRGVVIQRTDLSGDLFLSSDGGEPMVAPAPLPF